MTRPAAIRSAAVAALVLLGLGLGVPAALAHATLEEASPANGAVVAVAPARISLRFNEQVETALGSVRVFDAKLHRVDAGTIVNAGRDTIAIGVRRGLANGTYTIAWRVISADSHPVHGAFMFHVGAASAGDAGVALADLPGSTPPGWVDVVFGIARFAGFTLILLVAGGVCALGWVIPEAFGDVRRTLVRSIAVAAGLLVVATLAGLPLQAVEAGADASALRAVAGTAFGQAWLLRAAVALAIAVLVLLRPGRLRAPLAALAVVLAATPALAGHARVEGLAAAGVDLVHVLGAAAWAGGLAMLLIAIGAAGERRWQLATTAVPRFSTLALAAVGGLIVAGTLSAYLETRSVAALTGTTYGRLVLLKIGLLLPIVAMAAVNNRRSTPALRSGSATAAARLRFLRLASAELALAVVVLALTAALVAEPPGRVAAAAARGPVSATAVAGPFEVGLVVDPARSGQNAVHLYLLDAKTGQPAAVDEATISATLPSAQLGPLRLALHPAGPGHYVSNMTQLPVAGRWLLDVTARVGDFDQYATTIAVPVRGG